MKVVAPNGNAWSVRRLLLPDALRPSLPSFGGRATPFGPFYRGAMSTQAQMNIFGALANVLLALAILVIAPLLIPLAVAYRRLSGKAWWVEATSRSGDVKRWRVQKWEDTSGVAEAVASELRKGVLDPRPAKAERVMYWGPKDLLGDTGDGFYRRSR
jgi:hypothetical protein